MNFDKMYPNGLPAHPAEFRKILGIPEPHTEAMVRLTKLFGENNDKYQIGCKHIGLIYCFPEVDYKLIINRIPFHIFNSISTSVVTALEPGYIITKYSKYKFDILDGDNWISYDPQVHNRNFQGKIEYNTDINYIKNGFY